MSKVWSMKTVIDVNKKSNGICWYCGEEIEGPFTIDHVLPVSRGGTDALTNKKLGMILTRRQEEWLKSKGIEVPSPDPYYFWFERTR